GRRRGREPTRAAGRGGSGGRAAARARTAHRPGGLAVRRLLPVAFAVALALVGGTARADTYRIVSGPGTLPGLTPNDLGVGVLASLSTPPAQPAELSYPQLLGLWQRAGAAYGIPWQLLAAINKVESNFGRNMGPSSAGAIGWMQFMPDTWYRWGVDA